jgi:hypothetical protein
MALNDEIINSRVLSLNTRDNQIFSLELLLVCFVFLWSSYEFSHKPCAYFESLDHYDTYFSNRFFDVLSHDYDLCRAL